MSSNIEVVFKKKIFNEFTDIADGVVVFDSTIGEVYVGGDCFCSDVKDASYNQATGVLTIVKTDGTETTANLSGIERGTNKVTSLSPSSTNIQYPSAKCLYDSVEGKPVVVWEAQNVSGGVLASETDVTENPAWQITGLDLSPYKKVKLYIRSGGTGADTTSSAVITIGLVGIDRGSFGHFIGSELVQYPNSVGRLLGVTAAVSKDKTKVFFSRCTSLYGTSSTGANSDGRVLYKIVGYPGLVQHEYVEIGGIKWATKNIGAETIYDYGLYFQWGDTLGYTAAQVGSGSGQKYFDWSDYKFNPIGDGATFTKYSSTDGKTVLDLEDDAVNMAWGGGWRMPTAAEFQALGDAVNAVWTTNYNGSGVNGLVCTDKTDSSKVLFFPAAGYFLEGEVKEINRSTVVRTRNLYSQKDRAYVMYFDINKIIHFNTDGSRKYGRIARGVLAD